ncbi:sulfotransferase ssu-1-like [Rhipicephalus microplus]|uniref:sulfotransferase ssu-1-like n=1 Tax=Rhipicephalus microplus TaxID=6941 RepID=UPI003F6D66EA
MTEEGKYVYIARNPWDVCVSLYHMMTNMRAFEFQDGASENFAHAFISGDTGSGDYFEHVATGYALREQSNVFFVTYEELKQNAIEVVRRLAYFLGEVTTNGTRYFQACPLTCSIGHDGDENKYEYVRKGKVEGWKDYFTPDLPLEMEKRIMKAEKESSFMDLSKDIRDEACQAMQDVE